MDRCTFRKEYLCSFPRFFDPLFWCTEPVIFFVFFCILTWSSIHWHVMYYELFKCYTTCPTVNCERVLQLYSCGLTWEAYMKSLSISELSEGAPTVSMWFDFGSMHEKPMTSSNSHGRQTTNRIAQIPSALSMSTVKRSPQEIRMWNGAASPS
jgi:hypothetical protein